MIALAQSAIEKKQQKNNPFASIGLPVVQVCLERQVPDFIIEPNIKFKYLGITGSGKYAYSCPAHIILENLVIEND